MSVNSELSSLLTKMGGTPLESDSNSDLIKKISNAYEGGGGGSSGGSGILVVNETVQDDGQYRLYTLDKTYSEICNSNLAIIRQEDSSGAYIRYISQYGPDDTKYYVTSDAEEEYTADSENDYPQRRAMR